MVYYPSFATPKAPVKPASRKFADVAKDQILKFTETSIGQLQWMADIFGPSSDPSTFSGYLRDNSRIVAENYSDEYKKAQARSAAEEALLAPDDYWGQFKHSVGKAVENPGDTFMSAAGQSVGALPFLIAGAAAAPLRLGGLATRAIGALGNAAAGVGATRGGSYDTILGASEEQLSSDPRYGKYVSEFGEKAGREKLASEIASLDENGKNIALSALISGGLGAIGAQPALAEAMAIRGAGKVASAEAQKELKRIASRSAFGQGVRMAAEEIPQEILDEGSQQYLSNKMAASGGAKIDPMQGVVDSAVQAAIMAGPVSGIAGAGETSVARGELAKLAQYKKLNEINKKQGFAPLPGAENIEPSDTGKPAEDEAPNQVETLYERNLREMSEAVKAGKLTQEQADELAGNIAVAASMSDKPAVPPAPKEYDEKQWTKESAQDALNRGDRIPAKLISKFGLKIPDAKVAESVATEEAVPPDFSSSTTRTWNREEAQLAVDNGEAVPASILRQFNITGPSTVSTNAPVVVETKDPTVEPVVAPEIASSVSAESPVVAPEIQVGTTQSVTPETQIAPNVSIPESRATVDQTIPEVAPVESVAGRQLPTVGSSQEVAPVESAAGQQLPMVGSSPEVAPVEIPDQPIENPLALPPPPDGASPPLKHAKRKSRVFVDGQWGEIVATHGSVTWVDLADGTTWAYDTNRLRAGGVGIQKNAVQKPRRSMRSLASGILDRAKRMITWHGSGAKFDKFSLDWMGTGEGAQAFGWGLYLAQRRGTAKFYYDLNKRKLGSFSMDRSEAEKLGKIKDSGIVESINSKLIDSSSLFRQSNDSFSGPGGLTDARLQSALNAIEMILNLINDIKDVPYKLVQQAGEDGYSFYHGSDPYDDAYDPDDIIKKEQEAIVLHFLFGERGRSSSEIDDEPGHSSFDIILRYLDQIYNDEENPLTDSDKMLRLAGSEPDLRSVYEEILMSAGSDPMEADEIADAISSMGFDEFSDLYSRAGHMAQSFIRHAALLSNLYHSIFMFPELDNASWRSRTASIIERRKSEIADNISFYNSYASDDNFDGWNSRGFISKNGGLGLSVFGINGTVNDLLSAIEDQISILHAIKNIFDSIDLKSDQDSASLYMTDLSDAAIATYVDSDATLKSQPNGDKILAALERVESMSRDAEVFPQIPLRASLSFQQNREMLLYQSHLTEGQRSAIDKMLSEELLKEGFRGIKFFDGASRLAGKGTRNFVVFVPDDIKILRRNGKPVSEVERKTIIASLVAEQHKTEAGTNPSFEIVHLPFGTTPPADVIDGHRSGKNNITNTIPGEPGWLGNPYIANDVKGGTMTRKEAVAAYRKAFYAKLVSTKKDKEGREIGMLFRQALEGLRGKKVGYYKPDEKDIHLQVIQDYLSYTPPAGTADRGVLGIFNPSGAPLTDEQKHEVDIANNWHGLTEEQHAENEWIAMLSVKLAINYTSSVARNIIEKRIIAEKGKVSESDEDRIKQYIGSSVRSMLERRARMVKPIGDTGMAIYDTSNDGSTNVKEWLASATGYAIGLRTVFDRIRELAGYGDSDVYFGGISLHGAQQGVSYAAHSPLSVQTNLQSKTTGIKDGIVEGVARNIAKEVESGVTLSMDKKRQNKARMVTINPLAIRLVAARMRENGKDRDSNYKRLIIEAMIHEIAHVLYDPQEHGARFRTEYNRILSSITEHQMDALVAVLGNPMYSEEEKRDFNSTFIAFAKNMNASWNEARRMAENLIKKQRAKDAADAAAEAKANALAANKKAVQEARANIGNPHRRAQAAFEELLRAAQEDLVEAQRRKAEHDHKRNNNPQTEKEIAAHEEWKVEAAKRQQAVLDLIKYKHNLAQEVVRETARANEFDALDDKKRSRYNAALAESDYQTKLKQYVQVIPSYKRGYPKGDTDWVDYIVGKRNFAAGKQLAEDRVLGNPFAGVSYTGGYSSTRRSPEERKRNEEAVQKSLQEARINQGQASIGGRRGAIERYLGEDNATGEEPVSEGAVAERDVEGSADAVSAGSTGVEAGDTDTAGRGIGPEGSVSGYGSGQTEGVAPGPEPDGRNAGITQRKMSSVVPDLSSESLSEDPMLDESAGVEVPGADPKQRTGVKPRKVHVGPGLPALKVRPKKSDAENRPFGIWKKLEQVLLDKYNRVAEIMGEYIAELAVQVTPKTADEIHRIHEEYIRPLAKMLQDANIRQADFEIWLIAANVVDKRGATMIARGGAVPFAGGIEEARMLYEKHKDDPVYQKAHAIVKYLSWWDRYHLNKSGLQSADSIRQMVDLIGESYVPWRRAEAEEDGYGPDLVGGLAITGHDVYYSEGMKNMPFSPIATLVEKLNRTIVRANHNEVLQTMARFILEHPSQEWDVVPEEKIPAGTDRSRMIPFKDSNSVPSMIIIKNDPHLAHQIKGMQAGSMYRFIRHMAGFTHLYAKLSTTMNFPLFPIRNFIRDVPLGLARAYVLNEPGTVVHMVKNLAAALKGVHAIAGDAGRIPSPDDNSVQAYWMRRALQMKRMGATVSFTSLDSAAEIKSKFASEMKKHEKNASGRARLMASQFLDGINRINETIETGLRLAYFDKLMLEAEAKLPSTQPMGNVNSESLLSPETVSKITRKTRELTADFQQKGEIATTMGAVYPFFNASLRGGKAIADLFVELGRGNKKAIKLFSALVTVGLMEDFLNSILSGDDDDDGITNYDSQKAWRRRQSFTVPIVGTQESIILPMTYGLSVPINLGKLMGSASRGRTEAPEFASEMAMSVFESTDPLGGSATFLQDVSPLPLDWAVQIGENKNWDGEDIYPERFPGQEWIPNSEIANKDDSELAKGTARLINAATGGDRLHKGMLSKTPFGDITPYPGAIDAFAQWIGGGLGRVIYNTLGTAKAIAEGKPVERVPLVSAFIASPQKSFAVGRFYEQYKGLKAIKSQFSTVKADARREALTERYPDRERAINMMTPSELERVMPSIQKTPELMERIQKIELDKLKLLPMYETAAKKIKNIEMSGSPDAPEKVQEIVRALNKRYVAAYNAR